MSALNLRLAVLAFVATAIGTGILLWTLHETRLSSRRELRAYLFVEGTTFADGTHQPTRPQERMGIIFSGAVIKNSGNTPAHQVRHWSAVDVAMVEKEEELRAPVKLEIAYAATLPPGGTMTAERRMARKPTARMIKAIQSGRAAVFIYGAIEYLDVFGDSHRTNYRLAFSGQWPPPELPNLLFCHQGNEAD